LHGFWGAQRFTERSLMDGACARRSAEAGVGGRQPRHLGFRLRLRWLVGARARSGISPQRSDELPRENGRGFSERARPARLRLPVLIRQLGAGRRLFRAHVDARLHEHEPPTRLLLLPLEFRLSALEFLWTGLEHRQLRADDERRGQQRVKDDRHHHALAPRDGAADDVFVLIPIVEIEMNHGRGADYKSGRTRT
jgi:hypothetical protein